MTGAIFYITSNLALGGAAWLIETSPWVAERLGAAFLATLTGFAILVVLELLVLGNLALLTPAAVTLTSVGILGTILLLHRVRARTTLPPDSRLEPTSRLTAHCSHPSGGFQLSYSLSFWARYWGDSRLVQRSSISMTTPITRQVRPNGWWNTGYPSLHSTTMRISLSMRSSSHSGSSCPYEATRSPACPLFTGWGYCSSPRMA